MANRPVHKVRISNWEASVWDNVKKMDGIEMGYKTVTLSRSYKKKDENIWRNELINNIRRQDIAKIQAILNKIQDYLFFEAHKEREEEVEGEAE